MEDIDNRRVLAVSALQGNSAYVESTEGMNVLQKKVQAIEDAANNAIRSVYSSIVEQDKEHADPYGFFEAGRRGMQRNGLIN